VHQISHLIDKQQKSCVFIRFTLIIYWKIAAKSGCKTCVMNAYFIDFHKQIQATSSRMEIGHKLQ